MTNQNIHSMFDLIGQHEADGFEYFTFKRIDGKIVSVVADCETEAWENLAEKIKA